MLVYSGLFLCFSASLLTRQKLRGAWCLLWSYSTCCLANTGTQRSLGRSATAARLHLLRLAVEKNKCIEQKLAQSPGMSPTDAGSGRRRLGLPFSLQGSWETTLFKREGPKSLCAARFPEAEEVVPLEMFTEITSFSQKSTGSKRSGKGEGKSRAER